MMKLECISLTTLQPISVSEANVICLGNFDGVHIGHRTLLRSAAKMRDERFPTARCGVFCFRTPPSSVLAKEPIPQLSSLQEKLHAFAEEGMEFAILADFAELHTLPHEQFAKDILQDACHCVAAVCGFNYHYGHRGLGTPETLCKAFGGAALVVDEVTIDGLTVSSSRIRALLSEGDVASAARLLTHPYTLTAPVLHGKALGRRLDAPTVNQKFPSGMLIPRYGVYLTQCTVGEQSYRGISNVGVRPTVETDTSPNCETYLFDFKDELYGRELQVSFLRFIRPERRFDSTEELRRQIAEDIRAAKEN